jgi:hypothetical protein
MNRIHSLHQYIRFGYLLKWLYGLANHSRLIHALDPNMDPDNRFDPQPEKIRTCLSYRFRRIWIAVYNTVHRQIHYDYGHTWSTASLLHAYYPTTDHRTSIDSSRSLFLYPSVAHEKEVILFLFLVIIKT